MTDATTYQAKPRAVIRDGVHKLYHVYEWNGQHWEKTGRGYPHSTSAYAKLGRIVNVEAQQAILQRSN